jgi:hypothetical protein
MKDKNAAKKVAMMLRIPDVTDTVVWRDAVLDWIAVNKTCKTNSTATRNLYGQLLADQTMITKG